MKTIEETKKWLLENRVDEYGDLELSELDFSDFDGDVYIGFMKVKNNLIQNYQKVEGDLDQSNQKVKENLWQNEQEVKGKFITQTLKIDEKYEINNINRTYIVKAPKELTLEELKAMLGFDFKIVEKEEKENE